MKVSPALFERLLRSGKGVRRRLPGGGRLRIDAPLPALVVYRIRPDAPDSTLIDLFSPSVSFLAAPADAGTEELVRAAVATFGDAFGGFVLVEVWPGEPTGALRLLGPGDPAAVPLINVFQGALRGLTVGGRVLTLETTRDVPCAPPGLAPLLDGGVDRRFVIGLEVPAVYRDPDTGDPYPLVLRELRRQLLPALRRGAYAFMHQWTSERPVSFHALGSKKIEKAVWDVDRKLAEVADTFDFLLQVTPVNAGEAWARFKASNFERAPELLYRPLPIEPTVLKRNLYAAPIDRVDDPALYTLFREKQDEIDRQITLLLDMNTPRFVHGSVQLFGGSEEATPAASFWSDCVRILRRRGRRSTPRPWRAARRTRSRFCAASGTA